MLLHVVVGDLIRDALVAERCDQPIEDRRGVVLSYCCSHAVSLEVGANLIDQVRRAGQAANAVDHSNRVIDGGCPVVNFGMFLAVAFDDAELSSPESCSNHRHELALRIAVAVDVPLRGLDRPMAGQQLNIAQRAASFVHQPRRAGDERSVGLNAMSSLAGRCS